MLPAGQYLEEPFTVSSSVTRIDIKVTPTSLKSEKDLHKGNSDLVRIWSHLVILQVGQEIKAVALQP